MGEPALGRRNFCVSRKLVKEQTGPPARWRLGRARKRRGPPSGRKYYRPSEEGVGPNWAGRDTARGVLKFALDPAREVSTACAGWGIDIVDAPPRMRNCGPERSKMCMWLSAFFVNLSDPAWGGGTATVVGGVTIVIVPPPRASQTSLG